MSIFWQREKHNIDRRQSLAGVPVLNQGVRAEPGGDGGLLLRLALKPESGWMARFRPPVDSRRYELDAFGAFVVSQVDGRCTVMEIINRFQEKFGMSRRESELGVVAFIKMLMKRHLLSVGMPVAAGRRQGALS